MADKWIQLMSEDGTDNLFPVTKMDLLWTNASPTTAFTPQTVSLDLSDYRLIGIEFNYYKGTVDFVVTCFMQKHGFKEMCIGSALGKPAYRGATVTNSGVTFTEGNTGNGSTYSTNNDVQIPYKIYGVK